MGVPPREPRRDVAETMSATSDEPATPPPHGAVAATANPTDPLPEVDRACYEVGPELARGGLGRLVRAIDRRLGRVVALKLLRVRSVDREARFRREARITARLQHPGIVPVHEAGRWPDGEPFYAMKLLEGETLKAVVARRASLDERLALLPSVLSVCEAVAYAHAQGVIHRDIKPSNVMVGEFGETVLVDWGLAKELGEAITPGDDLSAEAAGDAPDLTREGKVVGTAPYLPPEQARGEPVTETADVYSLGALLYHVLTGVAPYAGKDDASILAQVTAASPQPAEVLEPGIPRELRAIVHKAMARSPRDRYPAARELAGDLRRFLTGQLVGAHQYSRRVLLLRWLRRYRQAVAVSVVSLVVLAVAAVLGVRSILGERDDARVAERRAVRADAEVRKRRDALLLAQAESWLERDPTQAIAWLKSYAAGDAPDSAAIERIAREAEARGVARLELHGLGLVTVSPTEPQLAALADDQLTLVALRDGARRGLGAAPPLTSALAFSPDGRTVAVASAHDVLLLDVGSAGGSAAQRSLAGTTMGISLAFSSDGKQLAVGRDDGGIVVLDLASGTPRPLLGHSDGVDSVVFSPDGRALLSNSYDRSARLWDVATGASVELPDPAEVTALAFGPSGLLAWGSSDGALRLRGADGGIETLPGAGRVASVGFSSDGARVLGSSSDGTVRSWERLTNVVRVLGHDTPVTGAWFARDGVRIITAAADRKLRVWDSSGGLRILTGATASISSLVLSADGELISVCSNGDVRVWSTALGPEPSIKLDGPGGRGIGELPGATPVVLMAAGNGRVAEWDLAGGRSRLTMDAAPDVSQLIALSPDGSTLLASGGSGRLASVRISDRRMFWVEPGHQGPTSVLTWAPDSTHFATGGIDSAIHILAPGSVGTSLVNHRTTLRALAFSPDGKRLASGGDGADVRLWNLGSEDGQPLRGHTGVIYALRFSPDGGTLASAGGDATIRLWDVASAAASRTLRGHAGVIDALEYSPDGTLISSSQDGSARVWRPDGSALLLRHDVRLTALALSSDGTNVATGAADGSIRVWRVRDGALLRVLRRHRGEIGNLLLTRDGKWLVSSSDDVTARAWSLGDVPEVDRAWLEQLTAVNVDTPR